jgi:type II secretory pathway pseudopilin PulG
MVVLFILAILVSLAVGVGMYVMDKNNEELTKTIQTTVWGAVQAYYDYGSPKAWAADRTGATYDPNASTTALMKFLTGTQYTSLRDTPPVQQAIARLKNLPKDAYATTLNDGWGRPMRYYQDKGMGGRPVLISAGSDGDFGDADSAKQKDNVISDGQ